MAHGGTHLGELADIGLDLVVEDSAVGHHDDRIEYLRAVALQRDQLVGQPGDGEALAAAGRVLDQVPLTHTLLARVGEQFAHHVELLVPWPDLDFAGSAGFWVLR